MPLGNPDLVWIEDAVKEYKRSRGYLDKLVDMGQLSVATFPGDRKVYLLRSELDVVILKPQITKRTDEQAG